MLDRVGERDSDVQVMMFTEEPDEKYQLELPDRETVEQIGLLAIALFTMLQQTQPKPPVFVMVVGSTDEAADQVKEVAQAVIAPPVAPLVEKTLESPRKMMREQALQNIIA